MASAPSSELTQGLSNLQDEIHAQCQRVQELVEVAFESIFQMDKAKAEEAINRDEAIDRIDVEIERKAVALLSRAAEFGQSLGQAEVRQTLMIVKINNQLERIADAGVFIAERVTAMAESNDEIPASFRMMANSVLGILRDMTRSLSRMDDVLARVVLNSEHTVEAFKEAILRNAEERIADGRIAVEFALLLHELANLCERMADHASNIAEQVIYSATGAIVRHTGGAWQDIALGE
ncbi:MAG: hypothetical protein H6815_01705 [Phycisphaeraceae bacterium]|nr:hypothetical protein [Phycisphaerales bacterium]MCB9859143.1 hypothetical protein [Phycisphaeraceae bacterium]